MSAKKYFLFTLLLIASFLIQAQNPVGAIPGVIDVSPMGAATYTIPIEVVPGTQGVQPNLSVVYNSFGGMGLLGMKWNLSGLSAITRCTQLPYYDDWNISEIQFNENDRFSLDGNRLLKLNSGIYGSIEGIYATEMEDFTRIISYGGALGCPNYFKAYIDDGFIIEYGNSDNSKQKLGDSNNSIIRWNINKITDSNGNHMTFHYGLFNSEIWIDSIRYSGNGFVPFAKVVFRYIELSDTMGKNTSVMSIE